MKIRYIALTASLLVPGAAEAGLFGFGSAPAHNTLIDASDVGNKTYVQRLVSEGYPVNGVDAQGQTALMKSAMRGNEDVTKILIKASADINYQDKAGNTALHYAAQHDQVNVAKILMDNGADTDLKNKEGKTALQEAMETKSVNVAKLIDPSSIVAVENEAFFPVLAAPVAAAGLSSGTVLAGAAGVAGVGGAAAALAGGGGGGGSSSSSGSSGGGDNGSGNNGNGGNGGSGGSGGNSGGGNNNSGGNSGGSNTIAPVTINPEVGQLGNPSSWETPEYYTKYTYTDGTNLYYSNNGLGQIKASAAYARGASGSGVTVAVVDTGG